MDWVIVILISIVLLRIETIKINADSTISRIEYMYNRILQGRRADTERAERSRLAELEKNDRK